MISFKWVPIIYMLIENIPLLYHRQVFSFTYSSQYGVSWLPWWNAYADMKEKNECFEP